MLTLPQAIVFGFAAMTALMALAPGTTSDEGRLGFAVACGTFIASGLVL